MSAASVGMAVAPVAIPAGVLLLARFAFRASWPLALVVSCVAIPLVWYATHQQTWNQAAT